MDHIYREGWGLVVHNRDIHCFLEGESTSLCGHYFRSNTLMKYPLMISDEVNAYKCRRCRALLFDFLINYFNEKEN